MRIGFATLVIATTLAVPMPGCAEPAARQIQPLEETLRVRLSLGRRAGWTLHASGFYVTAQGHAFTNAHAVMNCQRITLSSPGAEPVGATLLSLDTRRDIAVLRADSAAPLHLELSAGMPGPRQPVTVLSFREVPRATSPITASASRLRADPDGREGIVALTSPVSDGQSGSPVIGEDGQVVGLVIGRQADTGRAAVASREALAQMLSYLGLAHAPAPIEGRDPIGPMQAIGFRDALVAVSCH